MSVNPRDGAVVSSRIALEDVITAASEGALRALGARQRVPQQGEGFFVELHIRCGIPAVALRAGDLAGVVAAAESSEGRS